MLSKPLENTDILRKNQRSNDTEIARERTRDDEAEAAGACAATVTTAQLEVIIGRLRRSLSGI
jgi:hypothetical protein